MARRMELPKDKVHVVLNGIDLSDLGDVDLDDQREPVVGYLARFAPEKGLLQLVRGFKALLDRGNVPKETRLQAAGCTAPQDGAYVESVKAEINKLGLQDRVKLIDCPDKKGKIEHLKSLRVLSVPAIYGESFGLYILEALACGTPVVQPDIAAFPEIIHATGGGLLVKPDDAEALAIGLERVLTDDDEHRKLRTTGHKAVHTSFSAERMAKDVIAVCEKTIGAANAG